MPSKAFSQANLLGTDNTLQATSLSADIPITELYANIDELPASGTLGEQAFVQSTNRLYIWNGSGWYNIALINTTPTWDSGGQPAASYELDADSPQGSVTVTLSASDPEGIPIAYSYITSGQMDSIATISQDSSVFTINPKSITQAPDGGTGSITFRASDGINILPYQSSFTLNFISIITDSKYTTLLATATGTSDNNNITDASTNNHSITVGGDATAGTFSPYRSGVYSMYFDGSGGDYVRSPTHADFGFSTDDFTIECWYYPVSKAQNFPRIWHFGQYWSNANSLAFMDRHNSWSTTFSLVAFSGGEILNSTTTVENGNWYHLTVERSGTTITLYVNGVAEDTYNIGTSQFITSSTSYVTLGNVSDGSNLNESQLNGYIRDFRYVKGTAVYDGNFTPTTEPLAEVTNTKLFTAHLPYITDGSNNHSLTLSGDVYTKPFSPYDYEEYDAAYHGGSVYFDGTTDYLLINSPPTLGANDWTFETWYYASNPLTYNSLLSQGPGNNTIVSNFSVSGTGEIWIQTYTTTNVVLYNTAAGIIKGGVWNHIVLTHEYDGSSGGTYKIYVNGNQVGSNVSYTSGYYWNSGGIASTALGMAQYRYNTQANGECYFSDWKISNSVTYSSNFTPPTAPLSSTGSELHIKGTDASIIDKSQGDNLKLVGNTTGSTAQVKFAGTKSIYSDGTAGNHIRIPADDSIFSKDYTIEFWMYPTQDTNLLMPFSKGVGLQFYHQSGNIAAAMSSANSGTYFYNGNFGSITTNAWSHISLVRDLSASTYKFYINGTLEDTLSSSTNINAGSADWIIAAYSTAGSYAFEGYIQDVRVTEGLTRYTANFTPPTAPLKG